MGSGAGEATAAAAACATVDVAIVGAGYAGLSAGLALTRNGRLVAAFDAVNPGEGASTRNGGITSGSIRPITPPSLGVSVRERPSTSEAEGKVAREFLYEFIRTEASFSTGSEIMEFCVPGKVVRTRGKSEALRQSVLAEVARRAFVCGPGNFIGSIFRV